MSALHKQISLKIPLPEIQEHADSEVAWLKSHHADDLLKLMEEFRALVYSERTSLEEARSFTGRLYDQMAAEGGKGPPDYIWFAQARTTSTRKGRGLAAF